MLWRVRTTLPDRPGSLATLARRCGERSVNVLGLQIFPGVDGVTDELVLATPDGWTLTEVAEMVEDAGGTRVVVGSCTEQALADGPTRYLTAVRRVLGADSEPGEVLAGLLDARADASPSADNGPAAPAQDVLEVEAGRHRLRLHRASPFTATEHARASAFGQVVTDLDDLGLLPQPVVEPPGRGALFRAGALSDTAALVSMHGRCSAESVLRCYRVPLSRLDVRLARRLLVGGAGSRVAVVGGAVVGLAALSEVAEGRCEVTVLVEDRYQRQGLGTQLLGSATRQAAAAGAHELVMRGPAESPAAVAMVFGSGLRARVRLVGDELVVTVSTRGLAPGSPDTAPPTGVPQPT